MGGDFDIVAATERALSAATHLTPVDDGAVEGLRALARKIQAWDQIVDYALEDLEGAPKGARPAVPQNDNVSLSAYLKYCDQLGLSPAGRKALALKKEGESAKAVKLRALQGGKAGKRKA